MSKHFNLSFLFYTYDHCLLDKRKYNIWGKLYSGLFERNTQDSIINDSYYWGKAALEVLFYQHIQLCTSFCSTVVVRILLYTEAEATTL